MKILLAISVICLGSFAYGNKSTLRSELRTHILDGYDKHTQPDGVPLAKFGYTILNMHLCPMRQVLSTNGWTKMTWVDERLAWNETLWGVNTLRVPASDVWKPDFTFYNSAGKIEYTNPPQDDRAVVMASGMVIWVPAVEVKTTCTVNFKGWPFGDQTCSFKVGSWVASTELMDIAPWSDYGKPLDFEYFAGSNMIEILGTDVEEVIKKYDCCEEDYKHMKLTINFKHKARYSHGKLMTPETEEEEE